MNLHGAVFCKRCFLERSPQPPLRRGVPVGREQAVDRRFIDAVYAHRKGCARNPTFAAVRKLRSETLASGFCFAHKYLLVPKLRSEIIASGF